MCLPHSLLDVVAAVPAQQRPGGRPRKQIELTYIECASSAASKAGACMAPLLPVAIDVHFHLIPQ